MGKTCYNFFLFAIFFKWTFNIIKSCALHDCIISDANGYITNIDVYSLFREWFRNSFSFRVVPNKDELIEDLLTRWGPYNKGRGWIGYRYRTLKDDEREGKVITIDLDEEINQDINKSDAPV